MRAVVSRVKSASVRWTVNWSARSARACWPWSGSTHTDTQATAVRCARKVAGLRILRDGDRDEAAADAVLAPVLVVSQFTLYGDPRAGRRPSWQAAAPGPVAEPLIDGVVTELRRLGLPVETGRFGAMMDVSSVNDGPFTILLEI